MATQNAVSIYLGTKDLLRNAGVGERSAGEPTRAVSSQALNLLLEASFPSPVAELFEQSRLDVAEFAEAVGILEQAGLVEIDNGDSPHTARLTQQGQALRSS
jgi:hypothetical protein